MNRVYFIRHGATAGNLQKRYIGCTDEPLCKQGVFQVFELKKYGLYADCIFSSPALRTVQTARILFPQAKIEIVEHFMETDFGIFEGKNAEELQDNPEYRLWVDSGCQTPIPDGESVTEFKMRCCNAFRDCMREIPDGKIAAFVIHGGGIMAILERFAQPHRDFYEYHIGNGCFLEGEWGNGRLSLIM